LTKVYIDSKDLTFILIHHGDLKVYGGILDFASARLAVPTRERKRAGNQLRR